MKTQTQTNTKPDTRLLTRIADGESWISLSANLSQSVGVVQARARIQLRGLSESAYLKIPDNDTFANYLRSIRFELGF